MYYVYGSTSDRQLAVVLKGSVGNLIFKTPGCKFDSDVFELEEETGACFVRSDDHMYYIVMPTKAPENKKIKPATVECDPSEERILHFMKFAEEDENSTDYAVSSKDQNLALVDHSKYTQCGIGAASLGSPFHVVAVEQDIQINYMPTEDLQKLAGHVYERSRTDKQKWLDDIGDMVGLGSTSRSTYVSSTFVSKVNKRAMLFIPDGQDHADTAAMLLLRSVGEETDSKLAEIMNVGPEFIGNAGDESAGGVILGQVGAKTVGLCCLGICRGYPVQLAEALIHAAPKTIVIDFESLNFTPEQIAALSQKAENRSVCVVVPRNTDADVVEELQQIPNGEIVRNTGSKSIASRVNSGISCTVIYGCAENKVITEHPFEGCNGCFAALVSPLFATSLLQPANWESVKP